MVLSKRDAKKLRRTMRELLRGKDRNYSRKRSEESISEEDARTLRGEIMGLLSEEDAESLRQEVDDLLGIPKYSCPRNLMNQFYNYGLRFFPKSMTKNQAKSLIGRTLNISDKESEEVFQQFRHGGIVCDGVFETGLVGDHTILSLKECRSSSGEVSYYPSRYNPAYSGGFQGG